MSFMKNLNRSLPFLGCTIGSFVVASQLMEYKSFLHLIGTEHDGGENLKIISSETCDDIEYSREFQRMRYLNDPKGDDIESKDTDLLIKHLGGEIKQEEPVNNLKKKAPHYKYY